MYGYKPNCKAEVPQEIGAVAAKTVSASDATTQKRNFVDSVRTTIPIALAFGFVVVTLFADRVLRR